MIYEWRIAWQVIHDHMFIVKTVVALCSRQVACLVLLLATLRVLSLR